METTTNIVIEYLEQHYPANSIVPEWGTKQCSVDIAIFAEDEITPVAIYEIKGKKDFHNINIGIKQLRRAREVLNLTIPYYLIFSIEKEPYFEIFDASKIINNNEDVDIQSIMTNRAVLIEPIPYKNLNAGALKKTNIQKREKQQKRIGKFEFFCWRLLPVIFLIFFALDFCCIYQLKTERLILLGGAVIIVLLPFFSEISLNNILSFKRSVATEKQLLVKSQEKLDL